MIQQLSDIITLAGGSEASIPLRFFDGKGRVMTPPVAYAHPLFIANPAAEEEFKAFLLDEVAKWRANDEADANPIEIEINADEVKLGGRSFLRRPPELDPLDYMS